MRKRLAILKRLLVLWKDSYLDGECIAPQTMLHACVYLMQDDMPGRLRITAYCGTLRAHWFYAEGKRYTVEFTGKSIAHSVHEVPRS